MTIRYEIVECSIYKLVKNETGKDYVGFSVVGAFDSRHEADKLMTVFQFMANLKEEVTP